MPTEYLTDHRGAKVPVSAIKETDLIKDEFVNNAVDFAKQQRDALANFKRQQIKEMDSFIELLAGEYSHQLGGKKGNVTLRSFDQSKKVVMQVQETTELGPELLIAKDLIDECLREWSAGANENLQAIIEQTFQTDKKGKVSVQRVMQLRRLKIDDDSGKWQRAMDIIADSLSVVNSSRFIRFYEKHGEVEHAISLDIAKL